MNLFAPLFRKDGGETCHEEANSGRHANDDFARAIECDGHDLPHASLGALQQGRGPLGPLAERESGQQGAPLRHGSRRRMIARAVAPLFPVHPRTMTGPARRETALVINLAASAILYVARLVSGYGDGLPTARRDGAGTW